MVSWEVTNKYDKPSDSLTTLAGVEAAYLPDLRKWNWESEEVKPTFRVSKAHGKWNHHCSQITKRFRGGEKIRAHRSVVVLHHTKPRKEEAVPFAVASHRIKCIDFNLTEVLKTCTLQIGKYCCRKEYINGNPFCIHWWECNSVNDSGFPKLSLLKL